MRWITIFLLLTSILFVSIPSEPTAQPKPQPSPMQSWRIAVESWLRSRGYIKVHINQKCHPISPPFLAH